MENVDGTRRCRTQVPVGGGWSAVGGAGCPWVALGGGSTINRTNEELASIAAAAAATVT